MVLRAQCLGKTQQSVQLLLRGVNRLLENINTITPEFAKHSDQSTLLTTIVKNLHAVSRFKHEMFSVLQYAMDFRTISKESLKLITKWKASYFTHPASYYPVPQSSTYPASRVSFRIFLEKSGRLCSYDMERAAVKRSAMKRSAMKTALRTLMKKLEKRR